MFANAAPGWAAVGRAGGLFIRRWLLSEQGLVQAELLTLWAERRAQVEVCAGQCRPSAFTIHPGLQALDTRPARTCPPGSWGSRGSEGGRVGGSNDNVVPGAGTSTVLALRLAPGDAAHGKGRGTWASCGPGPGGVRDAYALVLGRRTALCSFAPRFRGISINYFCGRPNAPSFPLGRIRFGNVEITSSPTSNGVCSQSNYFEVLFMG